MDSNEMDSRSGADEEDDVILTSVRIAPSGRSKGTNGTKDDKVRKSSN